MTNLYDVSIDTLLAPSINFITLSFGICLGVASGVLLALLIDWLLNGKSREESDEKEKCPICERRTIVDMICYNCNHEFFYEEHESDGQILSARSIKISYF